MNTRDPDEKRVFTLLTIFIIVVGVVLGWGVTRCNEEVKLNKAKAIEEAAKWKTVPVECVCQCPSKVL